MHKEIQRLQEEIEHQLRTLPLPEQPANLYAPVKYSLLNGGKRIRPLMTLLACEMFGKEALEAMGPALGLELLHNFTLLHDDIMDNAEIRRNMPTVHKRWNVNAAILSGDVMFALACQLMAKSPEGTFRPVMTLFNDTVTGICEGQQYDMDFEKCQDVSPEAYLEMIRLKTAILPAACLQTGAIIGGATAQEQREIYGFGEKIGLAFQLRDDWLDTYGDEQVFGKKTGGDIIANKKTWLYIQALSKGDARQRQRLQEAFSNGCDDTEKKIETVKGIYDELGISGLATKEMEAFTTKAFSHLNRIALPETKKEKLASLAGSLLHRKS